MNTSKVEADNSADVELANRIMHTMIVKGVTLKALAADTGITYSSLRRSLHQSREDSRSLTFPQFLKIAEALEVQPSILVTA